MTVIVGVARGHNASTTLMIDGKIIFYLEEERLSRRKYDGSPLLGLLKVFDFVDHIDHLIICHTHRHGPELDWTGEDLYQGFVRKLQRRDDNKEDSGPKTHYTMVDTIHHELHASVGFINSGFDTAACVIADGAGSFLQTEETGEDTLFEFETIFKAKWSDKKNEKEKKLVKGLDFDVVYKHLGTDSAVGIDYLLRDKDTGYDVILSEHPGYTKAYEAITCYCGFNSIDAGKTMGLSPYGKENPDLPPLIRDGWVNRDVFIPDYPNGSRINDTRYPILEKDKSKHKKKQYTQIQKDMAYAVQKETQEAMSNLIRKAHDLTGEKNIVICGGYGLNCVANYQYLKDFPDLNIYCEPISHDGGTSIGAVKAFWARLSQCGKDGFGGRQRSIYYGPQYNPDQYLDVIGNNGEVSDTSYDDVAKLIRSGEIVTIFQGRSEGGPRALGNRSILFDPTVKDGKDIVNAIKRREFFRPFACSIKKENVHEWFDLQGRDETPHMMYAVECLPGVQEKIPSVIHVDGTCRIQTLTEDENEHYYKLIDAFEQLSGVPILFNTSFNLGGDPLVETIGDALHTLKSSKIEYMYLPEIQKLVKVPNAE